MIILLAAVVGNDTAAQQNIAVAQGQNATINGTTVDENGAAYDLTGKPLRFRANREDGTAIIDVLATVAVPSTGNWTVPLASSVTDDIPPQQGRYDVWVNTSGVEWERAVPSSEFWILDAIVDQGDPVSSPGPDMLLVGIPVPTVENVGKAIVLTDEDPATLEYSDIPGAVLTFATIAERDAYPATEGVSCIVLDNGSGNPQEFVYTSADLWDTLDSVVALVAGTNVTIDDSDPAYPVISASGGGGAVDTVTATDGSIVVDNADPANPTVGLGAVPFATVQTALAAADGDVDLNGQALTGLAPGVAATDALTVGQLVGRDLTLGVASIGESHPADPADGIWAYSTTDATAILDQWSPMLSVGGAGWKSSTVTTWAALTAYATGDHVRPTAPNGYTYVNNSFPGTSLGVEPVWPTVLGDTITDGGDVIWTCYRDVPDAAGSVAARIGVQALVEGGDYEPTVALGIVQTIHDNPSQLLARIRGTTRKAGIRIDRGHDDLEVLAPTVTIDSSTAGNGPALKLVATVAGWSSLHIEYAGMSYLLNQAELGMWRNEYSNVSEEHSVYDSDVYAVPHDPYVFTARYQDVSATPDKSFMRWRMWENISAASNALRVETFAGALLFAVDSAGRPQFSAANEQTTVGAAGAASALPATPSAYFKVKDSDGNVFVIPAYAAS
jgi:hypothetical protein